MKFWGWIRINLRQWLAVCKGRTWEACDARCEAYDERHDREYVTLPAGVDPRPGLSKYLGGSSDAFGA